MFGQNPLKDVDSRVFTRMLRKDGRTDERTDGRVIISLRNFVGEGIIMFVPHVTDPNLRLEIDPLTIFRADCSDRFLDNN